MSRISRTFSAFIITAMCSTTALALPRAGEVIVEHDSIKLAGTLAVPADAPRAIIVFATGSGAQDRDETVLGHKPFRAIADSLASHGYASLRLDDRGAGLSSPASGEETTDDFAADISAAIDYVGSIYGADIPVGVLGHSEGGSIALRLGAARKCRFIITLAAPAFKGDSVLIRQARELLENTGMKAQFEASWPEIRERYNMLMMPGKASMLQVQLYARLMRLHPEYAGIPQVQERVRREFAMMTTPWYRAFLRFDPTDCIVALDGTPWLAINGTIDRQVTVDNLDRIKQLCPSARTVALDSINHLMLKGVTGLPAEYDALSGDIDPLVIATIISWLDATTL